ncbi:MAG: hypothetical protein ACJATE_000972 [Bacteroidia bacterium]|jgi:hypothetical protein
MKDQHFQFSLIDNTYAAENAREVITSLINDKIKFLNIQMLSNQERFGSDVSHLQKRVKELEADRKRMIALFVDCAANDKEIEISCEVKLVTKEAAAVHA